MVAFLVFEAGHVVAHCKKKTHDDPSKTQDLFVKIVIIKMHTKHIKEYAEYMQYHQSTVGQEG